MKNNEEYVTTERNASAVGEKRIFQTNKHLTTLGVAFISAVPQVTVTTALKLFTFWQDKRNCNPGTL